MGKWLGGSRRPSTPTVTCHPGGLGPRPEGPASPRRQGGYTVVNQHLFPYEQVGWEDSPAIPRARRKGLSWEVSGNLGGRGRESSALGLGTASRVPGFHAKAGLPA